MRHWKDVAMSVAEILVVLAILVPVLMGSLIRDHSASVNRVESAR